MPKSHKKGGSSLNITNVRKHFRQFFCVNCSSKNIKPVIKLSETEKHEGTFWNCENCGCSSRERKVVES